jgi:signal transduction histidine kinase
MLLKLKYRPPRRMSNTSLLILFGMATVLGVLAVLQYRWITQISEAEESRQKESLDVATIRFAEDFESELRLLFPNRRPGPPEFKGVADPLEQLAGKYDQWMAAARHPGLLQDLFLAKVITPGEVQLFRFDPDKRSLEPTEWPSEFSDFHRSPRGRGPAVSVVEHIPAFSFPVMRSPGPPPGPPPGPRPGPRSGPPEFGRPRDREFGPPPGPTGWEIVRLNRKVFDETFLPFLVQRHFSKQGDFDYDVLVAEAGIGTVVYRSSPNLVLSDFEHDTDASIHFAGDDIGRLPRPGPPSEARFRPEGPESMRGWQLYAKHRTGSLQSFADQFRRRNLLVSFGVLAVLATGIAFTLLSSERVRALGRMQLEFAAGLSHELRTPLAVVRSAGYNLAAGNVSGGDEVVRYGKLLQEQGLRLSDMVEQALLFAQAQSGGNPYERTPVEVAGVIEKAIDCCRAILPKYPCEIVAKIPSDLPLAMTEPNALGHCVHNLLINALKYGHSPGSINVTAQPQLTNQPPEIEIAIENTGPGLDPSDLPYLFEPFFRGKNAAGVPGSGLGLYIVKSIVESLGGRVNVSSSETRTRFSLHIPAMRSEPRV